MKKAIAVLAFLCLQPFVAFADDAAAPATTPADGTTPPAAQATTETSEAK